MWVLMLSYKNVSMALLTIIVYLIRNHSRNWKFSTSLFPDLPPPKFVMRSMEHYVDIYIYILYKCIYDP